MSKPPQPGTPDVEVIPTQVGYDRWAEIYDDEDNPLVLLEEQHIAALIGEVNGLDIADIGCGTGRHTVRLASKGGRVTALDFSDAMLQRARAKPGAESIRFLRHDLTEALPLESHAFDRVFNFLVLDHIPDPRHFFSELHRVCRPSGWILVSVMHPAMLLRGVQARFVDPVTGRKLGPASYPHQTADYLMAALEARLSLDYISEHTIDAALAASSPRSAKYQGWPLLLLMRFRPAPDGSW